MILGCFCRPDIIHGRDLTKIGTVDQARISE